MVFKTSRVLKVMLLSWMWQLHGWLRVLAVWEYPDKVGNLTVWGIVLKMLVLLKSNELSKQNTQMWWPVLGRHHHVSHLVTSQLWNDDSCGWHRQSCLHDVIQAVDLCMSKFSLNTFCTGRPRAVWLWEFHDEGNNSATCTHSSHEKLSVFLLLFTKWLQKIL